MTDTPNKGHHSAAFVRAVTWHREGNQWRWASAMAADHVAGKRVEGETLELARQMALSTDQIYNLSIAAWTYKMLRQHAGQMDEALRASGQLPLDPVQAPGPSVAALHQARRTLTPSHYTKLGKLWTKHEFDPHDAFSIMQTTAETGASVEAMATFVENEHRPVKEHPWSTWQYAEHELEQEQHWGEWLPDGRWLGEEALA